MSKTCGKCGHENGPGAIYCENCKEMLSVLGGARRNDEPPPQKEEVYEAPPQVEEKEEKKGKSCLTCGCLALMLIVVLVVGAIAGGGFYASSQLEAYTTEKPLLITEYKPKESEIAKVEQKIQAIKDGSAKVITFTAADLNTLVSTQPDLEHLKGKAYFYITKNVMRVKGNMLNPINNRYFAGRVDIKAITTGDDISIKVASISLEDAKISQEHQDNLKEMNLYDIVQALGGFFPVLNDINNIDINNGRIQVILK